MKCIKGLLLLVLGTMLISTVAFADVPNKVAVIGDKAYDLDYVNDPKNADEIRKLLSEGKPVMVKVRDKWYNNNGEIKEEKNAPFKMSYKNSEGAVKEITTAYFEKQSSIIVGIKNSKEVKIIFNHELDKSLLNKEAFRFDGELLGVNDEIVFDEENKIVIIKFNEDINLKEAITFSIGDTSDEVEDIEKNIKVISSQEDINKISDDEKFYDIAIIGDDLTLDLSSIEGNVFVNGNNIEISKLNTKNLQLSDESEKITLIDSKVENLNTDDEDKLDVKNSEVANVNGEEKKEENNNGNAGNGGNQGGGSEYVSPWVTAKVEEVIVYDASSITIILDEVIGDGFDIYDKEEAVFRVFQNGKELETSMYVWCFDNIIDIRLDREYEKVDGEWVNNNKFIPGHPITVKYNANKESGLTIGSKYVRSFEVKSDVVREFKSVDKVAIAVKDDKTFNGVIDNVNRVVELHEDLDRGDIYDTLGVTENGSMFVVYDSKYSEGNYILLIGEDGSIVEYSVIKFIAKDIEVSDFESLSIEVNEEAVIGDELIENFRVSINGENTDLADVEFEDGKIKFRLKREVYVHNGEFIAKNKIQTGDKVKIEYLARSNKIKVDGVNVLAFEREVRVQKEFKSISNSNIEIDDETFPGEIIDDEIIFFIDKWDGVRHVIKHWAKNSESKDTTIDLIEGFDDYLFFIAQDGSIKSLYMVERIHEIAFEDGESTTMKVAERRKFNIINNNNMKLSVLGVAGVLEAKLDGETVEVKALKSGVGIVVVRGQMVRSDGSIVEGSDTTILKRINVFDELVTSISMPTEVTLFEEEEYAIKARVYPNNATNKTLKWESSDVNVATVNSEGVITAISAGEAIILAEAESGVTALCKVTVKEKVETIDVSVNGNNVVISLDNITAEEVMALLQIQNVKNGNIEVFNKYDLVEGSNKITFELGQGKYKGYIRIKGRKKYAINEFDIQ